MAFAIGLREFLQDRERRSAAADFTNGEDLEMVLGRYLRTVEEMAAGELITSVLLLSSDGKRLSHGAAPRLPHAYCDAIDGSEIGPCAGSCGTAAYFGHPVYVADIATDPLWANYRQIALPHGLRSCWSTPICANDGAVLGTFAIYRDTVGSPTDDEIDSIDMITRHVAEAIVAARSVQDLQKPIRSRPRLRLATDPVAHLASLAAKLQSKAAELDRLADLQESDEEARKLKDTVELSQKLVDIIHRQLDELKRSAS